MVSWWVPYLAKGSRPDLNNGPADNSNCGPILSPWRLFESELNNGPSPRHSNLGSDGSTFVQVPTCGLLVSAISGQGPRLDFNSCPWDNLNSGRILVHRRLFESDSNNSSSPGHSNLGQLEDTPVQVSHSVSWWVQYWPRASGLTSIMAKGITRIVAPI